MAERIVLTVLVSKGEIGVARVSHDGSPASIRVYPYTQKRYSRLISVFTKLTRQGEASVEFLASGPIRFAYHMGVWHYQRWAMVHLKE